MNGISGAKSTASVNISSTIKRFSEASREGQAIKMAGIEMIEKRLRTDKPAYILPFIGCPFRNCPQPGTSREQRKGNTRLCIPENGVDLTFVAVWYASPALHVQKISAQKRRSSTSMKTRTAEIS
jgi:hypothetical protein